jgi:hypothetical protein
VRWRNINERRGWVTRVSSPIDVWFPVLSLVLLGVLVVLGVSGSSLSAWSGSGRADQSTILAGKPLAIRSDEWMLSSPLKIGQARAGFPDQRAFGLGTVNVNREWRPQIPSRSPAAALYSPFNLPLVVLPLRVGFPLYWWLPLAVCLLAVYAWLRLLGVEAGMALASAVLVATAPASVWWSHWLALAIGSAAVPCALLVGAIRLWGMRPVLGTCVGVVAGLSAAGLPWTYQPWAIPVALFTGGVSLLWALQNRRRRRALVVVGGVAAAVFAVESLVYYLHEGSYYAALASSVYPGARRFVGGGMALGRLFSSLFPFALSGPQGKTLINSNLSEISAGWTVVVPATLGLLIFGFRALKHDHDRAFLYGAGGLSVGLSSWCFVRWPAPLARLSLMMFSQPYRTAPLLGYFGVVLLALVLGSPNRRGALARATGPASVVALGIGTGVVALFGALDFRSLYLPRLASAQVALTVVLVALFAAALLTRWSTIAVAAAVVLAIASAAVVNPVIRGLGEIDRSQAAKEIRRIDRALVASTGGRWATDGLLPNGLLTGQGVNSLSSYNDPVDRVGWQIIDPAMHFEDKWNRFGYIVFQWVPGQAEPVVEAPQNDIVVVSIDPCDPRLSRLQLKVIVTTRALPPSACLNKITQLQWQGQALTLFERRDSSG